MRSDKLNRMMIMYNGFKGHATVNHIMSNIPEELINQLTGKQLGLIMSALNKSYHQGKAESTREIEEYIGMPSNVSLWAVIGDKNYLGYKEFADKLDIPEILSKRGLEVDKWNAESSGQ